MPSHLVLAMPFLTFLMAKTSFNVIPLPTQLCRFQSLTYFYWTQKKQKHLFKQGHNTNSPRIQGLGVEMPLQRWWTRPDQESQDFIKQWVSWCFMLHPAHARNVYGRGHFSGGFFIRIIEKTILILTPTISWNLSDSHVVGWRRPSLK